MADHGIGLAHQRERDKARAARMKRDGTTRTTGRCSVCYRIIAVDSWKSRYTHGPRCTSQFG